MPVSLFVFNGAVARDGIPLPALSDDARELLGAMLAHALSSSPGLRSLDHRVSSERDSLPQLEPLLAEILRARYPLQCEGATVGVATLDRARLHDGELLFTVNGVFAAFLVATNAGAHAVRPRPRRRQLPDLDDGEYALVMEGLRLLCEVRTTVWNFHAAHALAAAQMPVATSAFGLRDAEALVRKLEASA